MKKIILIIGLILVAGLGFAQNDDNNFLSQKDYEICKNYGKIAMVRFINDLNVKVFLCAVGRMTNRIDFDNLVLELDPGKDLIVPVYSIAGMSEVFHWLIITPDKKMRIGKSEWISYINLFSNNFGFSSSTELPFATQRIYFPKDDVSQQTIRLSSTWVYEEHYNVTFKNNSNERCSLYLQYYGVENYRDPYIISLNPGETHNIDARIGSGYKVKFSILWGSRSKGYTIIGKPNQEWLAGEPKIEYMEWIATELLVPEEYRYGKNRIFSFNK